MRNSGSKKCRIKLRRCYDTDVKVDYWTGSHTKHRLLYHFVFIPKYRKRVLSSKVQQRIIELFTECCQANGWMIAQLEMMSDHVHLLIQLTTTDSPAKAMKYLKGGSSRVIREEFPHLKAFLWGKNFWARGYFVESIGSKDEFTLKKYLNQQSDRHS